MDHSEILPNLLVGSCPRNAEDIDRLRREAGVTAVLCLQTDEDLSYWDISRHWLAAEYHRAGIEFRRAPIQDFDPDALRESLPGCVEVLDSLLREGHTVYLHCNVGVNRSPSVAIAYLYWVQGMPLDEAVTFVTQRRACDPYVEAVRLASGEET
jgi:protein-tyrosine phosphatase